jgi:hypothetical protein
MATIDNIVRAEEKRLAEEDAEAVAHGRRRPLGNLARRLARRGL